MVDSTLHRDFFRATICIGGELEGPMHSMNSKFSTCWHFLVKTDVYNVALMDVRLVTILKSCPAAF